MHQSRNNMDSICCQFKKWDGWLITSAWWSMIKKLIRMSTYPRKAMTNGSTHYTALPSGCGVVGSQCVPAPLTSRWSPNVEEIPYVHSDSSGTVFRPLLFCLLFLFPPPPNQWMLKDSVKAWPGWRLWRIVLLSPYHPIHHLQSIRHNRTHTHKPSRVSWRGQAVPVIDRTSSF